MTCDLRHLFFVLFITTIGFVHPVFGQSQAVSLTGDQRAYLSDISTQARQKELWQLPGWHRLLHYRENLIWGVTSEVDKPGFFLAKEGKTNPQAELLATLTAFFSQRTLGKEKLTAQCRFPARYRWLKEQLSFDSLQLEEQPCPFYDKWRSALPVESVSFVYATHNLNELGSLFGHPFLRLHLRRQTASANRPEITDDQVLSFAASIPDDAGLLSYITSGIFGGYPGDFTLVSYEAQRWIYNDVEDRDLWHYQLQLSPQQIDRMLAHLFELGSAGFDYFFFDENCAYQLLPLLEVARPELPLSQDLGLWALPTDVVRRIMDTPGLVSQLTYTPSRSSRLRILTEQMTPDARGLIFPLADNPSRTTAPEFKALSPGDRTLALEAALDVAIWRVARVRDPKGDLARRKEEILKELAKREDPLPTPPDHLLPRPPELGHGSSRVALGAGSNQAGDRFSTVSAQASYHNLLSLDWGYAKDAQLVALRVDAKREEAPNGGPSRTRLERFLLADIVALFPFTPLRRQLSWKYHLGWERDTTNGCPDCTPFTLGGGLGLALESNLGRREVYFAFTEFNTAAHKALPNGYRLGGGISAGTLIDLAWFWRLGLTGTSWRYTSDEYNQAPDRPRRAVETLRLTSRMALGVNLELLIEGQWRKGTRESSATLGFFF